MSSIQTMPSGPAHEPEFDLREIHAMGYPSPLTLKRRIAEGLLPRRLMGKKFVLRLGDVEALYPREEPESRLADDVERWITEALASAPPMTPVQRRAAAARIVSRSPKRRAGVVATQGGRST